MNDTPQHQAPRPDDSDHGNHGGAGGRHDDGQMKKHERRMYWRFAAMIATSTAVMFVLTYTNAYDAGHIRYSQERLYMALLMGGAMALVMLSFMVSMMYKNRVLNIVVIVTALIVCGTAYYASRTQLFVDDERYMRAMIPHHSIAILTSERAGIDDVRVRELADGITRTQRVEIKEMDWLIEDIEENGPATTQEEATARPVPEFQATAQGEATDPDVGTHWLVGALESFLNDAVPAKPATVNR